MKKVVIFEGLPGSGKTAVADLLAANYGFIKINESKGFLDADTRRKSQQEIFQDTLERYQATKESQGEKIIIDRGCFSILAWDCCEYALYHTEQLLEKSQWVNEGFTMGLLFQPTLYVYFKITPRQSLNRKPRPMKRYDVWSGLAGLELCAYFYEGIFARCKKIGIPVLELPAQWSVKRKGEAIINATI